jgi:hypothetical protein
VVPTLGFPYGTTNYGTGAYSLPNFYFASSTNAPTVASLSCYIAPGSGGTVTGTVTQTPGNAATATLTVTANSATTIGIGYIVTGGTLPTGSYILKNLTGSASSGASTWTVTVPQGTTIPTNASSTTYTVTPIVMTVTAVASGIINTGGYLYKSSGAPTANTYVTATANDNNTLTGSGGTGTYLVNISQTYASSGSPTSGISQIMPYVGFNSGDAFRVPMNAGDRTVSGYTVLIAYKWGDVTGHVSMMGSTHGNGGDYSWGRNAAVREYNMAGATATGGTASATGWHVTALRFDGTQTGNANRFQAWYDGTLETLTFTGTVGTGTTAPANITLTPTGATATGGILTATYSTTGSPAWVVGDSVTLGSAWTSGGTAVLANQTFTVTACTVTSVSFGITGTTGTINGGTITGTPIPNLMVSGKAPIASATKNTNPTTATQEINIGELLVYSSALSDSSISALTTYLKNKWLGTN